MNHYKDSEGNRFTTDQINRLSDASAKIKIELQLMRFGYNFCEECKSNDCKPIDVAHIISRKEAKETGRTELCWEMDNMKILGRRCHQILDKLI